MSQNKHRKEQDLFREYKFDWRNQNPGRLAREEKEKRPESNSYCIPIDSS
jgi:hypothetical protein